MAKECDFDPITSLQYRMSEIALPYKVLNPRSFMDCSGPSLVFFLILNASKQSDQKTTTMHPD